MGYPMFSLCYVAIFMWVIIIVPKACYSQETSEAMYYGSPDSKGTTSGACGYGEYGRDVNDGDAAAVSGLFKNGAGCGACYQIKCTEPECNNDGVTVIVTDQGGGGNADFILSGQAFAKMAKLGMEQNLKAYGHVNVEYQKVACKFPGKNIMLKVQEHSQFPNYLALVFYYQAGAYEITSVEVFEEARQQWRACRRAYGAVWDMANPPRGSLTVRFFAKPSVSAEAKWVLVANVLPVVWTAGALYDTSVQLT